MFTDKSIFALQPDEKRARLWREVGIRKRPLNITEHGTLRVGSIIVLAGISLGYNTDLYIFRRVSMAVARYRDEVLHNTVRYYAAGVGPAFVLMGDNVHPHRAVLVEDYLGIEGIARTSGWRIILTPILIQLNISRITSAVLCVHIYHPQPMGQS